MSVRLSVRLCACVRADPTWLFSVKFGTGGGGLSIKICRKTPNLLGIGQFTPRPKYVLLLVATVEVPLKNAHFWATLFAAGRYIHYANAPQCRVIRGKPPILFRRRCVVTNQIDEVRTVFECHIFFLNTVTQQGGLNCTDTVLKQSSHKETLYIRHVKLRVPRGPYGSHLCCHEGHTRQLTEVI